MRDREAGALAGTFTHASRFKYGRFRCQMGLRAVQKRFARVSVAHTFVASASPVKCDSVSHAFGVKFFWIIVRTVIEVINGEVLFVLHPLTQLIKLIWPSQPQDCLEDVLKLLLKFLLGFEVGVLLGFTHWCFRNVGRGSHVEVVKGACINTFTEGM